MKHKLNIRYSYRLKVKDVLFKDNYKRDKSYKNKIFNLVKII